MNNIIRFCHRLLAVLVATGALAIWGCGSAATKSVHDGGAGSGGSGGAVGGSSGRGSGGEVVDGGAGVGGSTSDAAPSDVKEAGVTTPEAGNDVGASDMATETSADAPAEGHVASCPTGMVLVKGGAYTSPNSTAMVIADFCMDVTEVTAGAFKACVAANICDLTGVNVVADPRCFYGKTNMDNYPMDCLATTAAVAYCQKNAKRLPSEVEWEWAARGGPLGDIYPWGTDAPAAGSTKLCWGMASGAGACETRVHPDGNTPSGIYDMAGNVAEIVSTAYNATNQVVKGGSYVDTLPANVNAVARSAFSVSDANPVVGFRCISTPQ